MTCLIKHIAHFHSVTIFLNRYCTWHRIFAAMPNLCYLMFLWQHTAAYFLLNATLSLLTHHRLRLTDILAKRPTTSCRKSDLLDWIIKKGVQPNENSTKAQLQELAKKKEVTTTNAIDEIAESIWIRDCLLTIVNKIQFNLFGCR